MGTISEHGERCWPRHHLHLREVVDGTGYSQALWTFRAVRLVLVSSRLDVRSYMPESQNLSSVSWQRIDPVVSERGASTMKEASKVT